MDRFYFSLAFCVSAILLAPVSLVAGGGTAKASLPQAVSIAEKWHSDAVLVAISTLEVDNEGSAEEWLYAFYSPSATRHLSVTVTGSSMDTLEVSMRFTTPVGAEFIDSDNAMALAKKNGLKGETPAMGMNVLGPGSTIRWWVNGGVDPGDVSVVVDAKTGQLWRKEVVEDF